MKTGERCFPGIVGKLLSAICLLSICLGSTANAKNYIILFKTTEIEVGSMEPAEYLVKLRASNQKNMDQLQSIIGGSRALSSNLWAMHGAVADLSEVQLKTLLAQSWVERVTPDRWFKALKPEADMQIKEADDAVAEGAWGLNYLGINRLRKEFPKLNGEGIRIGIIDTGIQNKHVQLTHSVTGADGKVTLKSNTVAFQDFVNGIEDPYDDNGHGTHVAGTIAGEKVGIAPHASLVVAKVLTADGFGSDSAILKAMQWMMDPDGDPKTMDQPSVVNNSWGGDFATESVAANIAPFTPYRRIIQEWIKCGMVPVFAAGNAGNATQPSMPGGLPEALAVGAVDRDGQIAEFSTRGPSVWNMGSYVLTLLKPDISAPGVKITSSYPGDKYASMSGTSMATPHVTGSIALARQANPKLNYVKIKDLLMATSVRKVNVEYGYGIMDTYRLVTAAMK